MGSSGEFDSDSEVTQPFLQRYKDFEISRRVFGEQPCVLLYERGS
jgi:hypothetical protein